jgi:hypothetical protein
MTVTDAGHPVLHVKFADTEPAVDWRFKTEIHQTSEMVISGLSDGMSSGKPSVAILIDLPGNTGVVAETSLSLFLTAADALKAHYGDPRE